MACLALRLESQQRHDQAEKMYRDILKLQEKDPGTKHPDTLDTMSQLARTLRMQQRLDEAEHLHRKVLNMRKTTLGVEHSDTLQSMY